MSATVEALFARGVAALAPASDSPRADAMLLLAYALGRDRASILAHGEVRALEEQVRRFERLCAQRVTGRPLAYVLGEAGFYGRTFAIDDRVLVPRPETERLVEAALTFLKASAARPPSILDVGCGSGAIGCTIAAEIHDADVTGTDMSSGAVSVSRSNARRLGVRARCRFLGGDLASPVEGRRFDVVLANLPYVPTGALPRRPNPLAFEPQSALDGGGDGLDIYRRFLPAAPLLLKPGALLLLEAAPPQMAGLLGIVRAAFPGLEVEVGLDFAGLSRYVRLEIPVTPGLSAVG